MIEHAALAAKRTIRQDGAHCGSYGGRRTVRKVKGPRDLEPLAREAAARASEVVLFIPTTLWTRAGGDAAGRSGKWLIGGGIKLREWCDRAGGRVVSEDFGESLSKTLCHRN